MKTEKILSEVRKKLSDVNKLHLSTKERMIEALEDVLNKVPMKHILGIKFELFINSGIFLLTFTTRRTIIKFKFNIDDMKEVCVDDTIQNTINERVNYIEKDQEWYDDLFS